MVHKNTEEGREKKNFSTFLLPFVLEIKSIILTNNLFWEEKKSYIYQEARTKCFLYSFPYSFVLFCA